jgi:hypothetical protein
VTSDIKTEAFRRLRSWTGFETITTLLCDLPELDIYLVGGFLRDLVLDLPHANDFDFLLGGDGLDAAYKILGLHGELSSGPFGSPRWYPFSDQHTYCDIVPIERFYNGLWRCEDIVDALNQFDFTGDALGMDVRSGAFFDPQNGLRDLSKRIMRAVRFDYPNEPIAAGHILTRPAVVWFRLLHYAAVKNLQIEPITLGWLRENRQFYESLNEFAKTFFPLDSRALDTLG